MFIQKTNKIMPNLLELHEYAIVSKNEDALDVTNRYINTSVNNSYILGGMVELKLNDNITTMIIKEVQSLLYYSEGESMNTEHIITILENRDINILIELIEEMRIQKLRMNGLLRAIVFWLSPARKRAAETVFHPSRIDFNIDI